MLARLLTLTALGLALAIPFTADGWEQTESDLGYPLTWPNSCFFYSLNEQGSDDISFDDLSAITRSAFDAWEDLECSGYRFVATDPAQIDEQAFHADHGNANLLVWRETAPAWPYGPFVVALTSVHYDPTSGEIQDVDIELNGYDFEFAALDSYPEGSELVDLQSTLTHEIGHTIGLAHSDVPGSTMSPYDDPGTTDKRTLEQDDIEGACTLYPLTDEPDLCQEPWCGLDLYGDSGTCGASTGDQTDGCSCASPGRKQGARARRVLFGLLGWSI